MPQLDVVIFFMEYVWLIFFIAVIYNLIILIFFPNISIFVYIYNNLSKFLSSENLFIKFLIKNFNLIFSLIMVKRDYILDLYMVWNNLNYFYLTVVKAWFSIYSNKYFISPLVYNKYAFFKNIFLLRCVLMSFNLVKIKNDRA